MASNRSLPESARADLIICNGKVVTVDKNFSIARAIAVKGSRILAVGGDEEITALAGKKTRKIDLQGSTVLPGINDAHIHASLFGGTRPPVVLDVSYTAVKSIDDLVNIVAEKAKSVKPGEWIRGMGLDPVLLNECQKNSGRYPTRWDLDRVSPDNPVYLGAIPFRGERIVLFNTRAWSLAGIHKDTPFARGGEVVKDPVSGEFTGLVRGMLADDLVTGNVPLLTREQKRQALLTAMCELNALGITSITEPSLGPAGALVYGGLWDSECISLYNDLNNEGKLTVRVSILLLFTPYGAYHPEELLKGLPVIGIHTGFGNEWLRIAGIKLFADGIPPMKTAWMYEDYAGGGNGTLIFSGQTDEQRCQELRNIVAHAHKLGFQIGIHATGDRSIDACIDGFVRAEQEQPKGLRHYIIHGDFVPAKSARRMAEYHVGVSVQPALANVMSGPIAFSVGKARATNLLPLKTLMEAGVHVSGGSDAPVTFPDWKQGIQAAVLRESIPGDLSADSGQRISREQAIRMYTIEGAWQDHMEHVKGSIEPGKVADFCILDEDILSVEPHKIKDIRTSMTIAGGKIVYNAR